MKFGMRDSREQGSGMGDQEPPFQSYPNLLAKGKKVE